MADGFFSSWVFYLCSLGGSVGVTLLGKKIFDHLYDRVANPDLIAKLVKVWNSLSKERQEEVLAIERRFSGANGPSAFRHLIKYYVEPDYCTENPLDDPFDVQRSPIMEMLKSFVDPSKNPKGGRQFRFILAGAGMGKTSFLLMAKYAELTSFISTGYKCEILKIGETTLEDLKQIKDPNYTLLLLDALDEDSVIIKEHEKLEADRLSRDSVASPKLKISDGLEVVAAGFKAYSALSSTLEKIKSKKPVDVVDESLKIASVAKTSLENSKADPLEERLKELLHAAKGFWRIIITCRTQFFPMARFDGFNRNKLEVGPFACSVRYLLEFSNEQSTRYIENRFGRSRMFRWLGSTDRERKAKRALSKMDDLKCRPLLLSYMDLIIERPPAAWTTFTVYETLIGEWLRREEEKSVSRITQSQLRACCSTLAAHMFNTGTEKVDVGVISELMTGSLVAQGEDMQNLTTHDFKGRSLLNRDSKGNYQFAHKTIQEFILFQDALQQDKNVDSYPMAIADLFNSYCKSGRETGFIEQLFQTVSKFPRKLKIGKLLGTGFCNEIYSCVDFSGTAVGADRNFQKSAFLKARFNRANFARCNFSGSIFVEVDFSGGNFEGSDFSGAKLELSSLGNAGRKGRTNFRGATFVNAEINDASISSGSFSNREGLSIVSAIGEELSEEDIAELDFREANLTNVMFNGLCTKLNFEQATLTGIKFRGGWLPRSNFAKAILRNLDLKNMFLMESNFSGADLTGADLQGAKLMGANLKGADLQGANLTNANLINVDLSLCELKDAKLVDVRYSSLTIWPVGYVPPDSAVLVHD